MLFNLKKIISVCEKKNFISAWEIAFKRKMNKPFYEWIFNDSNSIYSVLDNDRVVAGYCLLEILAETKTTKLKGVLCNNVFVNGLEYSKMGVFQEITNYALYENSKDYDFALGFPNQKAVRSHLRSGWTIPLELSVIQLAINLKHTFIKLHNTTTVDVTEDSLDLLVECDGLVRKIGYSFNVTKSIEFIKWRYVFNPRYKYKLTYAKDNANLRGFAVTKYFSDSKRIHVLDYAALDASEMTYVVAGAIKSYLNQGYEIDYIDLWTTKNDEKLFSELNFLDTGIRQQVIFNELGLSQGSYGLFHSAHLVLADNDVY